MKNFFKDKAIIRYNEANNNYREVLISLVENKNENIYTFHPPARPLNIDLPNIKAISLTYPYLARDKRWDSLHLTASSLFLGSSLTDAGFDVSTKKQILPATQLDDQLLNSDLIGLTLFEDLILPSKELLDRLKKDHHYNGFLAAGGPLITLNPYQAAFHLPEINLFVRGEAELIFPKIIKAINSNQIEKLLDFQGLLFQVPGLIVISDFDSVNRPLEMKDFHFNLDFLDKPFSAKKNQRNYLLQEGLEINVSRGCKRGCIFCSAVQGKYLRQLSSSQFEELLSQYSGKLDAYSIGSPRARTLNINDDDILQDPEYTKDIFHRIKKKNFHLWGIQTSINSFFATNGEIDYNVLDFINDPLLYVDNKPLVWAGTDTFLKERGKRLGKLTPSREKLVKLAAELEKREIANYHYWISSDHLSNWEEFIRELELIHNLQLNYSYFGLLPHAPFLVPYSTTPLYRQLIKSPDFKNLIKYKTILKADVDLFTFPLVERVETRYRNLNRLLKNESLNERPGFFDYLRQKDYPNAWITLYNFLKLERLEALSDEAEKLKSLENSLEERISKLF